MIPSPAVWVTEGALSLGALAFIHLHNRAATVLCLTAENSPDATYTAGFATYLNQVFAADKAKVPAGVTVWHSSGSTPVSFTSHGGQTLFALSVAWACECSEIVRLTAENSPGGVFLAGMAEYLDAVFERSQVLVPTGTSLYYLASGPAPISGG